MKSLSFFIFSFLFLFCETVSAQQNFWTSVNKISQNQENKSVITDSSVYFKLDKTAFWEVLNQAPNEGDQITTKGVFQLDFPNEDGVLHTYNVIETPVMEEGLAKKYPGIRSFTGVLLSDKSQTIRFDISPFNFHGFILRNNAPAITIDPVNEEGTIYQVQKKSTYFSSGNIFSCLTDDVIANITESSTSNLSARNADDGRMRTFRLALASTGEFSQHFITAADVTDAQKKARVLAAQNTHITRVNAIFEKELSIRLVLVSNNDAIIYLTAGSDPWTTEWNNKTQETLDAVIGGANYDVGHLQHKDNDNGNAGCIGCVCVAGRKGRAFTSIMDPGQESIYVVDYLAHEFGHQFGANHTYTADIENTEIQVEPGSGSTIMGYAGITGPVTDIQSNSDDYFHAISIEQISDYAKLASCATVALTGNTAPIVNAGADYIIPASTPFVLTGSATDANPGDALTYTWEQMDPYDVGSVSVPSSTARTGPLFRSIPPSGLNYRNFPTLSSILDGTNRNKWEVLPSVGRSLNFRFLVRDNHTSGGNNNSDDVLITVQNNTGPFAVSSPNTSVSWRAGYLEPITWEVNQSNLVPINAAIVNILLSTDGGQTFPTTLLSNTPNDGNAVVLVPAQLSTNCRIKIVPTNNIFFDINNANFTILASQPGFDLAEVADVSLGCGGQTTASATLNVLSVGGYSSPVNLTASNVPAGTTVSFSSSSVNPGQSVTVTLNNTNALTAGVYTITINGVSGSLTRSRTIRFNIFQGQSPSIISQPEDITICDSESAAFSVTANNVISYQWQVSNDGGNNFVNLSGTGAALPTLVLDEPSPALNGNLYRVIVNGQCNATTSNAAQLNINRLPQVTINAAPFTSLQPGQSTTLTANIIAGSSNSGIIEWIYNGSVLTGENTTTLTIDVNGIGTYQVRVIDDNGCVVTSDVLTITASESSQLFIYPNPNDGNFIISFYNRSGNTQQKLILYNSAGAKVYETTLQVTNFYQLHNIRVPHLQKGLYFVVLGNDSGEKLATGKVVIQ